MGSLGASLLHRSTPTWWTEKSGVAGSGRFLAQLDNGVNVAIKRMMSVGSVKALKTV
jgi:hypothetical protein